MLSSFGNWNGKGNFRSLVFPAPEFKGATQDLDPLFHGQEPQGLFLDDHFIPFKTNAIILDDKFDPWFFSFDFYQHVLRFSMFADIGQSFLYYPIDSRLGGQREEAIE